MSDQELYVTLESVLCIYAKPTFLAIAPISDDGSVNIVISCLQFRNMNIQERVNYVFSLLSTRCGDIIKERLIVIETYNSEEMESVLDNLVEEL